MTFDAVIGVLVTSGIGIVIGLFAMTVWDEAGVFVPELLHIRLPVPLHKWRSRLQTG